MPKKKLKRSNWILRSSDIESIQEVNRNSGECNRGARKLSCSVKESSTLLLLSQGCCFPGGRVASFKCRPPHLNVCRSVCWQSFGHDVYVCLYLNLMLLRFTSQPFPVPYFALSKHQQQKRPEWTGTTRSGTARVTVRILIHWMMRWDRGCVPPKVGSFNGGRPQRQTLCGPVGTGRGEENESKPQGGRKECLLAALLHWEELMQGQTTQPKCLVPATPSLF